MIFYNKVLMKTESKYVKCSVKAWQLIITVAWNGLSIIWDYILWNQMLFDLTVAVCVE